MKKTIGSIILLIICLNINSIYSQSLNKTYYGLPSDSISQDHLLRFINDSIVELSSIRRHMQKPLIINFPYHSQNGNIYIDTESIKRRGIPELRQFGFKQFLQPIKLKIEGNVLIDQSNNMVYILNDDFKKMDYTTFVVDGKEYRQKNFITDGYGLVKKSPKQNIRLKRKLKSLESDIDNYKIKIYKGINAYESFGYEYISGVIEIKKK